MTPLDALMVIIQFVFDDKHVNLKNQHSIFEHEWK